MIFLSKLTYYCFFNNSYYKLNIEYKDLFPLYNKSFPGIIHMQILHIKFTLGFLPKDTKIKNAH